MKAVIFDLDGTIIDSMGLYEALRLQELYKSTRALKAEDFEEIEKMTHLNSQAFIEYCNQEYKTEIDAIAFRDRVRSRVEKKYQEGFILKSNFINFIDYLDDLDIPYAVATASQKKNAEAVLNAMNLRHRFEFVLTTEELDTDKLDDKIYLEAAKRFNLNPEEVLVVEDAPHAVMTAKSAGFMVAAIQDDYFVGHEYKLKKYGDLFIESYDELIAAIEKEDD